MERSTAAQDATFARVLRETLESPSDDLILDAIEAARYNTFQANLQSKFAQNLTRWTNETPLLKFVVPFIKTPLNILKQGIVERTPLALLSSRLLSSRLRSQILSGDRAGRTALLRVMLGTAGIGMVWNLAADGRVTGSRVGRGSNRNTADLGDVPAYSVRIGERWYQYNRLDPMGTVIGLTADLRELANDLEARTANDIESDNPELVEAFGNLLGIITENVADKTFFKGFADLVEAAHSASERGSGSAAAQYAASIGSNLIPLSSLERNIAKAHDDYAREAWTFMDKLRASTPGNSESLPVRRDVLGRPVKNAERLGADWLSPFLVGKDDSDPAARALAELGMSYRLPDKDIAGVRLNPEQYSRLLEVRGQFLRELIAEQLRSGEWYDVTKYQRIEQLRSWMSEATHASEAAVMDQWPTLGELVERRRDEVRARKTGAL